MKPLRNLGLALAVIAIFTASAFAQKKTAPKKPAPKKPAATATKTVQPLEVRTAREKVDIQLANVTRFVDVMGPIVQSIETLDRSAAEKRLPKATVDKNEATKQKLIEAIRNLKEGLAALESEFRAKPALQKYRPNIEGITELAEQAEDTALSGKFVASKEPLRDAAKKLADTLAAIPV